MSKRASPDGWDSRTLGDLVDLGSGYGFPRSLQGATDEELPFFKVSDMSLEGNRRNLTRANNCVSLETAGNQGWTPFPAGGIAFAKVGAALLLNRRRVLDKPSLVDNNMMVAIPGEGLDSSYLYWWLQTVDFRVFVQPGVVPSVNQRQVGSLWIELPPLSEQRRIADVLDAADEGIRQSERVIAKLREMKKGLLHDLLTRGLDAQRNLRDPEAHPEAFKDSVLGRIPGEWELATLGQVAEKIQDGTHFSPQSDTGEYRYITSKNVRPGRLDLSESRWISEEEHRQIYARCDVQFRDVLLTKDGANAGNACLNTLGEPFSLLSSVAFIRSDSNACVNEYVLQYLLSEKGQGRIQDSTSGLAITRLTLKKIKSLPIIVPSVEEQHRILTVLDAHDTRIRAEEVTLQKLGQVKRGLMHDLLTGRVRVRV